MKMIVDIPDDIRDTIESDQLISREQLAVLQMHIMNGMSLTEQYKGMTNREVIKAMFPQLMIFEENASKVVW